MKLVALTLYGVKGWPDLQVPALSTGLNVFYGPPGSGKTTLAEYLGHVLFGNLPDRGAEIRAPNPAREAGSESKQAAYREDSTTTGANRIVPEGEAIIESDLGRYRLRRCRAKELPHWNGREFGYLTVASLDGAPVNQETVRRLLGGIPQSVLGQLGAIRFETAPPLEGLLATKFARDFHQLLDDEITARDRHAAELIARRDTLASELEALIASERRTSREFEQRKRALEGQMSDAEQEAANLELQLRSVEVALAETDARLRYRRLEMNTELYWNSCETPDWESQLADLDDQITRWRTTLAELARREASVRARLLEIGPGVAESAPESDLSALMALARQLTADLAGEVARLARASSSARSHEGRGQGAVRPDAHPRLRPIVETLNRQLDVLESLLSEQQCAAAAREWADEVECLIQSQAALRRQLERLQNRRQALLRRFAPIERPSSSFRALSAADADQLERRRLELEQLRFELVDKLRSAQAALRGLRAEQADTDRHRADLFPASKIEHVQRQLAAIHQELHEAANRAEGERREEPCNEPPLWPSDYLAQLTDGRLLRLVLPADGRQAMVFRASGQSVPLESLSLAERDQVYVSMALAAVSAARRRGVQLPLVLDDPFVRLDQCSLAAFAAVLDAFARHEGQVILLTGQQAAAERLASLGQNIHDFTLLRRWQRQDETSAQAKSMSQRQAVTVASQVDTPIRSTNPESNGSQGAAQQLHKQYDAAARRDGTISRENENAA